MKRGLSEIPPHSPASQKPRKQKTKNQGKKKIWHASLLRQGDYLGLDKKKKNHFWKPK